MIPLKPEHCAAAYEFLRALQPYDGWKLPPAAAVEFLVKQIDDYGLFYRDGGQQFITISSRRVGWPSTLIRVMAHEMIHVKQDIHGESNRYEHNAAFKRDAMKVCRLHGFDPKEF